MPQSDTGTFPRKRETTSQAEDIARRTRQAQESDWRTQMRTAGTPVQLLSGPNKNDPRYAIEGLQGNIAERQRQQAAEAMVPYVNRSDIKIEAAPPPERPPWPPQPEAIPRGIPRPAVVIPPTQRRPQPVHTAELVPGPGPVLGSFDNGGFVPQTGNYQVQAGEQIMPAGGPTAWGGATQQSPAPGMTPRMGGTSVTPEEKPAAPISKQQPTGQSHELWRGMAANVNSPLKRVGGFDDYVGSFERGGLVPETGIAELHRGERVIPKDKKSCA